MSVLGIGTDITECLRIAQMIERHGELFVSRVYTQHEIDYCRSRRMATQHFAGRWAAKEAVLKAIGEGIAYGLERFAFALDPVARLVRAPQEQGGVGRYAVCELAGAQLEAAGVAGAVVLRMLEVPKRHSHSAGP